MIGDKPNTLVRIRTSHHLLNDVEPDFYDQCPKHTIVF